MQEVADRVYVVPHEYLAVNMGVVVGQRGLLVVDTLWSDAAARDAMERVRAALGPVGSPLVAVVNTHDHWDHVLGNAYFLSIDPEVQLVSHECAAESIAELESPSAVPPTQTFSSVWSIDLGDRVVELIHPGRGHTAGDVVVRVGDADVVFAGDLVEESGPPAYGPDSFPVEWPSTLEIVAGLLTPASVVVPGHGRWVTKDFVDQQRSELVTVAETLRDLVSRRVPVEQALAEAEWPYDRAVLADAVRRAYEQLPSAPRTLPLV